MHLRLKIVAVLAASISSLASAQFINNNGEAIKVTCESGFDLTPFSLIAINPIPTIKDKDLGGDGRIDMESVPPNKVVNLRLDLCVATDDPSKMILKQVVYRPSPMSIMLGFIPTEKDTVVGISEAILDQNYSKLKLELTNDLNSVLIVGFSRNQQNYLAAVTTYENEKGKMVPSSLYALVGALDMGDPWADSRCSSNSYEATSTFSIGTAKLDVEFCKGQGAGETMAYKILAVTVTDANSKLSADEQKPVRIDSEDKLKEVMKYSVNHHNACDSFFLQLPHAEYAATAAAMAGCGAIVKNAPERTMDDQNQNTLYQIRYHDGLWEKGEMKGCTHYLLCSIKPE